MPVWRVQIHKKFPYINNIGKVIKDNLKKLLTVTKLQNLLNVLLNKSVFGDNLRYHNYSTPSKIDFLLREPFKGTVYQQICSSISRSFVLKVVFIVFPQINSHHL